MFTKNPLLFAGYKKDKLTLLKKKKIDGKYFWWCKCDCGNKKFIRSCNLYSTQSCGCAFKGKPWTFKHRLSRTRFYTIWAMMNQRCKNSKHFAFHRYGGRGIKVEWKSFEEFRNDMYESYLKHVQEFGEKETTIDRIDNDGSYYKSNCRWATHKEQANNTRRNVILKKFPGIHVNTRFISLAIGVPISLEEKILNLILKLEPRKAKILNLRYNDFKTLEEVGKDLGVTRERVRQIESVAIQELKNLSPIKPRQIV